MDESRARAAAAADGEMKTDGEADGVRTAAGGKPSEWRADATSAAETTSGDCGFGGGGGGGGELGTTTSVVTRVRCGEESVRVREVA